MQRITVDTLRALEACEAQIRLFAAVYPDGVDVTPESFTTAHRAGLNVGWVLVTIPDLFRGAAFRTAAIAERRGYEYARWVDKGPRDDTRTAAIAERRGYEYARWVDRGPRDDTRTAAIAVGWGYEYARWVDKGPRDDTRAAAVKEGRGDLYALYVDR